MGATTTPIVEEELRNNSREERASDDVAKSVATYKGMKFLSAKVFALFAAVAAAMKTDPHMGDSNYLKLSLEDCKALCDEGTKGSRGHLDDYGYCFCDEPAKAPEASMKEGGLESPPQLQSISASSCCLSS